ncbi:ABC transporter permease [Tessaracoccus sp. MC1679]|uniref:ABC transporter permease n=1 Tax=Tessaracoccus sp. MC1679 TaxID=2760313 RepID=UPI001602899E|nr:ABC transporter permease [Tessaracoccus sp. MC1679]MBB1515249.1 ABC transporter permease [Tessaracoccus sp. MC1679]
MSADVTPRASVIDRGMAADHRVVAQWGWWAVVEHHLHRMRRYLGTLLVTGIGSPIVYLLGLGAGLGVLVDGGEGIEGVPYLTFIAPALVMSTAMLTSSQENTYGVFGGFKWFNTFPAMRLTPISPAQMAVGVQVAALLRVLPVLVFYLAALVLFGIAGPLRALALLPVGLLLSVAVGFAVMAWVATQKDDRGQLSFIERFVVVPLTLFSGTYFPLETLPGYLQPIGWVSPLWHAAELGRWAMYGQPLTVLMVAVHFGFLALLAVVCAWLSIRTFRRRLDE